ncbi:amino acid ABC transporter permease [Herbaspirillum huttiense]|uniref:amino acid ABC transporter permease n=1 Tax=Herbaspirillum huttiense TaxID=863372 RepID=UPI0035CEFE00
MKFDWNYMFSLLRQQDFWFATVTVIKLSMGAWLISVVIGFVLALAKQSSNRFLSVPARFYIWLFRSLPLLVLLIFIYNLPQAIPSSGAVLNDPFWAGLIGLVLSETAYIAEIHRGGLLSIPKGQYEAAVALGLRFFGIQCRIVVPQAIRVALTIKRINSSQQGYNHHDSAFRFQGYLPYSGRSSDCTDFVECRRFSTTRKNHGGIRRHLFSL